MSSIDDEVAGVNVVALESCFEQLWVVNDTLFHEDQKFVLLGASFLGEVVDLDGEFVLQLAFLAEEFSVISVVEVLSVGCQRVEEPGLGPNSDVVSSQCAQFKLENLTSSEEPDSSWPEFEFSPVLHSRPPYLVIEKYECCKPPS